MVMSTIISCIIFISCFSWSQGDVSGEFDSRNNDNSGVRTFTVTLSSSNQEESLRDSLGLSLYQRTENMDEPSPEGDFLRSSTVVFPAVMEVVEGREAARAGVQVGDVLLAVNGRSVARVALSRITHALALDTSNHGAVDLLLWRRDEFWVESQSKHGNTAAAAARHVVSIVAYNRPQYLKRCLSALGKCRSLHKYTVLLFVEPEVAEVAQVARDFAARGLAKECFVQVNPVTMGFPHNLRQALEAGFFTLRLFHSGGGRHLACPRRFGVL